MDKYPPLQLKEIFNSCRLLCVGCDPCIRNQMHLGVALSVVCSLKLLLVTLYVLKRHLHDKGIVSNLLSNSPYDFLNFSILVKATGLVDSVSARKFLEAADKTDDRMLFFNVFRSVKMSWS